MQTTTTTTRFLVSESASIYRSPATYVYLAEEFMPVTTDTRTSSPSSSLCIAMLLKERSANSISVEAAPEAFTSVGAYFDFESAPIIESDEDEEGGETTLPDAHLVVRVLPIPSIDVDHEVGLMNMPGSAWRRGTQETTEEMSAAAYVYSRRNDQSGYTYETDEGKNVRQYHHEFKWRHRADLSSLRSVVSIADRQERPEMGSFSETKVVSSMCSLRSSRGEEATTPYRPANARMHVFAKKTRSETECANSMRLNGLRNPSNTSSPLLGTSSLHSAPSFSVEKTKACAVRQLSSLYTKGSPASMSPSLLRDSRPPPPFSRVLLPDLGDTFTCTVVERSALARDGGKGAELNSFFPNSCNAPTSPSVALHGSSRTMSNLNIAALSSIDPSAAA